MNGRLVSVELAKIPYFAHASAVGNGHGVA